MCITTMTSDVDDMEDNFAELCSHVPVCKQPSGITDTCPGLTPMQNGVDRGKTYGSTFWLPILDFVLPFVSSVSPTKRTNFFNLEIKFNVNKICISPSND